MRWLLLFALVSAGCSSPASPTPDLTPGQARLMVEVDRYARVTGLEFETRFSFDTTKGGWVVCPGPMVVNLNMAYVDTYPDYMYRAAAHEVCHLYYRHNEAPCGPIDEDAVTACGLKIMVGVKP